MKTERFNENYTIVRCHREVSDTCTCQSVPLTSSKYYNSFHHYNCFEVQIDLGYPTYILLF